jgi:amino acid transporter
MMILISFVMVVYLTVVPMFTKKVAIFQNYLFSFLRFIPLLFGIIGGLIIFVTIRHGSLANDLISTTLPSTPTQPFSLTSVSPFLGIIASIPAIFFSFDGFYTCSSLEKDMKKPEQFSKALVCGIIVVATFYILFSIFTLLAADGGTIIGLNNA